MLLWTSVDGAYGTELKDIRPLLDFGHSYGSEQRNIAACWQNNFVLLMLPFLPQSSSPEKPVNVIRLVKLRWLEEAPAEEIATWLQCRLKHVGQKTTAETRWGLPIKMADVVAAYHDCLAGSQHYPR